MYSSGTDAFHKLCHEPLPREVRGKNNGNTYMEIGSVSVRLSGKNRAYYSYYAQIGLQLVKEEIGIVSYYSYSQTTTKHQYNLHRALPTLRNFSTKYKLCNDKVRIYLSEIKKPDFDSCKTWISKRAKLKAYGDSLPSIDDLKAILILNCAMSLEELGNYDYWELYSLWYEKLKSGIDTFSTITHNDIPIVSDLKDIYKEFYSYDDRYKEYIKKRDSTRLANVEKKENERAEKYRLYAEEAKKFLEESKEMTTTEKCIHLHSYPNLIHNNCSYHYTFNDQSLRVYARDIQIFKGCNDLLIKNFKIITTTRNVKFPVAAFRKLCNSMDYNSIIDMLINIENYSMSIELNNYTYNLSFDKDNNKIRVGCHRFDPDYLKAIIPTLLEDDRSRETTESSD